MSNRLFKALKIKKDNYHLRYELAGADETIRTLGEKYSDLNKKYQLYKKAFELVCYEKSERFGICPADDCIRGTEESEKCMGWDRYYLKLAKEELEEKKDERNDI